MSGNRNQAAPMAIEELLQVLSSTNSAEQRLEQVTASGVEFKNVEEMSSVLALLKTAYERLTFIKNNQILLERMLSSFSAAPLLKTLHSNEEFSAFVESHGNTLRDLESLTLALKGLTNSKQRAELLFKNKNASVIAEWVKAGSPQEIEELMLALKTTEERKQFFTNYQGKITTLSQLLLVLETEKVEQRSEMVDGLFLENAKPHEVTALLKLLETVGAKREFLKAYPGKITTGEQVALLLETFEDPQKRVKFALSKANEMIASLKTDPNKNRLVHETLLPIISALKTKEERAQFSKGLPREEIEKVLDRLITQTSHNEDLEKMALVAALLRDAEDLSKVFRDSEFSYAAKLYFYMKRPDLVASPMSRADAAILENILKALKREDGTFNEHLARGFLKTYFKDISTAHQVDTILMLFKGRESLLLGLLADFFPDYLQHAAQADLLLRAGFGGDGLRLEGPSWGLQSPAFLYLALNDMKTVALRKEYLQQHQREIQIMLGYALATDSVYCLGLIGTEQAWKTDIFRLGIETAIKNVYDLRAFLEGMGTSEERKAFIAHYQHKINEVIQDEGDVSLLLSFFQDPKDKMELCQLFPDKLDTAEKFSKILHKALELSKFDPYEFIRPFADTLIKNTDDLILLMKALDQAPMALRRYFVFSHLDRLSTDKLVPLIKALKTMDEVSTLAVNYEDRVRTAPEMAAILGRFTEGTGEGAIKYILRDLNASMSISEQQAILARLEKTVSETEVKAVLTGLKADLSRAEMKAFLVRLQPVLTELRLRSNLIEQYAAKVPLLADIAKNLRPDEMIKLSKQYPDKISVTSLEVLLSVLPYDSAERAEFFRTHFVGLAEKSQHLAPLLPLYVLQPHEVVEIATRYHDKIIDFTDVLAVIAQLKAVRTEVRDPLIASFIIPFMQKHLDKIPSISAIEPDLKSWEEVSALITDTKEMVSSVDFKDVNALLIKMGEKKLPDRLALIEKYFPVKNLADLIFLLNALKNRSEEAGAVLRSHLTYIKNYQDLESVFKVSNVLLNDPAFIVSKLQTVDDLSKVSRIMDNQQRLKLLEHVKEMQGQESGPRLLDVPVAAEALKAVSQVSTQGGKLAADSLGFIENLITENRREVNAGDLAVVLEALAGIKLFPAMKEIKEKKEQLTAAREKSANVKVIVDLEEALETAVSDSIKAGRDLATSVASKGLIKDDNEMLDVLVQLFRKTNDLGQIFNLAEKLGYQADFKSKLESKIVVESAKLIDDLFDFEKKLNSLPLPYGDKPSAMRINFVIAAAYMITDTFVLAATLRLLSDENVVTLTQKKPELFTALLAKNPENLGLVLAEAGSKAKVEIMKLLGSVKPKNNFRLFGQTVVPANDAETLAPASLTQLPVASSLGKKDSSLQGARRSAVYTKGGKPQSKQTADESSKKPSEIKVGGRR